jgi:hypothetical protein
MPASLSEPRASAGTYKFLEMVQLLCFSMGQERPTILGVDFRRS